MEHLNVLWICAFLIAFLIIIGCLIWFISPNVFDKISKKLNCGSGSLLDKLIFPAKSCIKYANINEKDIYYFNVVKKNSNYSRNSFIVGEEIQNQNCINLECTRSVPYAFIKNENFKNANYYVIYFHGNGETIDDAVEFVRKLMISLKFHTFLIEYPKYGIYNHDKTTAELIQEDSIYAYQRIKEQYKLDDSQIFIFGRSIGTGPAIHVASQVKCKGLMLISPYKSLKSLIGGMFFGLGYIVSKFMNERFDNESIILNIQCRILLIHGIDDSLIPFNHSVSLSEKLSSKQKEFRIELFPNMTHNNIIDFSYEIQEKITFYFQELNKGLS